MGGITKKAGSRMEPNREKIDKVIEAIQDRHDFVMGCFFTEKNLYDKILSGDKNYSCKTACCVAGEAALLFPDEFCDEYHKVLAAGEAADVSEWPSTSRIDKYPILAIIASRILGLPCAAFFVEDWPPEISGLEFTDEDFDEEFGTQKRIDRAIEAIHFFIENPEYVAPRLLERPEEEEEAWDGGGEEEEEEED